MSEPLSVIWHELECGGYRQDLTLWLKLAAEHAGGPDEAILDVGAGSGRVSIALSDAGYRVVALDYDRELLAALRRRIGGSQIETVQADARDFTLCGRVFSLCIVPMQTLQLLGGMEAHVAFFSAARRHLTPGGVLAAAIAVADDFEEFQWSDGDPYPLPDISERGGYIYSSQPTAVTRVDRVFVLARRREVVDPAGNRERFDDRIALDVVTAADVEEAGQRAGLKPLEVRLVPPTTEHIGSEVVILGA